MTCKPLTSICFAIVLCLSAQLKAEVLHWVQFCPKGELHVQNNAKTEVSFWIQKFNPELVAETFFSLPAFKKIQIPIYKESPDDRYSLLHFLESNSLKVEFNCYSQNFAVHNFEGGVFYFSTSGINENKLWLQNLFSGNNKVTIQFLNQKNEILQTDTVYLASYEQKNYKIYLSDSAWSQVRVFADNRFTAFNIQPEITLSAQAVHFQPGISEKNVAYFLIGTSQNLPNYSADSFIVKIKDPKMIEKARQQISNPALEKIIFGRIQKGHAGYNRNWSKKEKPFWSWSVAEVTNIADIGSTACNGVPQLVENRIDLWIQDPGRICFWSYRIKKELTAEQVERGY